MHSPKLTAKRNISTLQIIAWQSQVRLTWGLCSFKPPVYLFSIFPLASAWCHGGLWNIKGSFQHCRRSDAQETSLDGCMLLALCPSGTSMPMGEGRVKCAFSLCSTHRYTHTRTSVPSTRRVCFYAVLFSLSSSLSGNCPSSLHPATRPELNTRGPSLSAGEQLHSPPQASQRASSHDRSQ